MNALQPRVARYSNKIIDYLDDAAVYQLDPPLKCLDGHLASLVVISTQQRPAGERTWVFRAEAGAALQVYGAVTAPVVTGKHQVALESIGYTLETVPSSCSS